jgi:hypothetical protein
VEFHHIRPYAVGGEATVENVQLRCRRHNDYEARVYFRRDAPNGSGGVVREEAATYDFSRSDLRDAATRSGTRRADLCCGDG